MNQEVKTCNWICLEYFFLEKVSFLQCALRMDSSGQNSIFKRQNRELDPFWPWWLVPAINRTARHTSQANMGSRDIHKLVLVISFQDFQPWERRKSLVRSPPLKFPARESALTVETPSVEASLDTTLICAR